MPAPPPAVSVVIPAYGVAPWIGATLQSVWDQTWRDWEVILVNDGSPDTEALESAIAPFRDRLTYLTQPNQGAAAARNAAIREARGEWVAFLDGDDRWCPDYLVTQLGIARAHAFDLLSSNGWMVEESGGRLRRIIARGGGARKVTLADLIRGKIHLHTSATIARREVVVSVGGFDESLRRAQDFDLWVRMVIAGARAGWHGAPLIEYRLRPGNLSGDERSQLERAVRILKRVGTRPDFPEACRGVLERRLSELGSIQHVLEGKSRLADGEVREAKAALAAACDLGAPFRVHLVRWLLAVAPGVVAWVARRRLAAGAG